MVMEGVLIYELVVFATSLRWALMSAMPSMSVNVWMLTSSYS